MLVDKIQSAPSERLAAVDCRGNSITYGELLAKSRALSQQLGPERRMVLLEGASTVQWLIAYVACLLGRHPVLITPAGATSTIERFRTTFAADVLLCSSADYSPKFVEDLAPKQLHPELAVLLSTSGSTGSAKCVRLSRANISANAASICEYLEISADERGVANLPTHYSYGLSVVNSHLFAGATLLLTDRSVIEPEFWDFLKEHNATSLQGVPYVYDLLSRLDLAAKAPKSLRYFTQAGGRLAPEKVEFFNELAQMNGWRFYVMYGQTEATARMAYMPAAELHAHPDSIGIAIPGGQFSLIDHDGAAVRPGEIGQLVYEGPNVMMGYASGIDELAHEPMPARLLTGDLGRVDGDGFYYIAGRLSRFIKIVGNRIGLDDVEKILCAAGFDAVATGVDDHLLVVTTEADKQAGIDDLLRSVIKLPPKRYSVRAVDEYPLQCTGKIDYQALKQSIAPTSDVPPTLLNRLRSVLLPDNERARASVRQVFLDSFGRDSLDENATFRSLGGDSLTYFSVAIGLESRIDQLPSDWDTRTISELSLMEDASDGQHRVDKSSVFANLDTLRGLACLMVVLFHVVGEPHTGLQLREGLLRWAVDSLDYFRMPLFAAIAGFFYAAIPVERANIGRFLVSRFNILIIPALCITPIYWGIRHIVYGIEEPLLPALVSGYQHLWFLYALMVILTIAALLDGIFRLGARAWGALVVIAPILSMNMPYVSVFSISNAIHLFVFFAVGVFLHRVPMLLRSKTILIAALLVAFGTLTLQQLEMQNIAMAITDLDLWVVLGGISCVLVSLYLVPRIRNLEAISIYTYAIYLWHPMANAAARYVLQNMQVENLAVLVTLGFLAGTFAPVVLHMLVANFRFKPLVVQPNIQAQQPGNNA